VSIRSNLTGSGSVGGPPGGNPAVRGASGASPNPPYVEPERPTKWFTGAGNPGVRYAHRTPGPRVARIRWPRELEVSYKFSKVQKPTPCWILVLGSRATRLLLGAAAVSGGRTHGPWRTPEPFPGWNCGGSGLTGLALSGFPVGGSDLFFGEGGNQGRAVSRQASTGKVERGNRRGVIGVGAAVTLSALSCAGLRARRCAAVLSDLQGGHRVGAGYRRPDEDDPNQQSPPRHHCNLCTSVAIHHTSGHYQTGLFITAAQCGTGHAQPCGRLMT